MQRLLRRFARRLLRRFARRLLRRFVRRLLRRFARRLLRSKKKEWVPLLFLRLLLPSERLLKLLAPAPIRRGRFCEKNFPEAAL